MRRSKKANINNFDQQVDAMYQSGYKQRRHTKPLGDNGKDTGFSNADYYSGEHPSGAAGLSGAAGAYNGEHLGARGDFAQNGFSRAVPQANSGSSYVRQRNIDKQVDYDKRVTRSNYQHVSRHLQSYNSRPELSQPMDVQQKGHGAWQFEDEEKSYYAQQMNMYSANSRNYHARPSSMEKRSNFISKRPQLAIAFIVICFILLVVVVLRLPALFGTMSKTNQVASEASNQQSQVEQLQSENSQLQSNIDSMQATIDAYNATKN